MDIFFKFLDQMFFPTPLTNSECLLIKDLMQKYHGDEQVVSEIVRMKARVFIYMICFN